MLAARPEEVWCLAPKPLNGSFFRLPRPHVQSEFRENWRAGDVSPPVFDAFVIRKPGSSRIPLAG